MAGQDPLKELDKRLTAVKVEFERYFMGLEKRWPARERDQLSRAIRRFVPTNNSVMRFRYQNIQQRHIVLERYWERILRSIEAGTYERDVFKADFRSGGPGKAKAETTRQSSDQKLQSKKQAKAVGDEAQAFLDSLDGGDGAQTAAPIIKMRGRSKRGNKSKD